MDVTIPDNRDKPAIAILKFYTEHEPVKGGESLIEVDYIEWVKRGSGATTVEKINRLKKTDPAIWSVVEAAYNAWKKGQEAPIGDGTPLEAWPAVTSKHLLQHLKLLSFHTVEHLSEATSADMERIGMGAGRLIAQAKAFVTAKQGQTQFAAAMAERDEENAALKSQLADLQKTVEQLAAAQPKTTPAKAPITRDGNRAA